MLKGAEIVYVAKKVTLWALSVSLISLIALAADWGYEGTTGPDFWGSLSESYALCGNGQSQSPINVVESVAVPKDLKDIQYFYEDSKLAVINNGHTLEFEYEPGSLIDLDDNYYDLIQFHFHAPSEHMINGHQFPMELHLVHRSSENQLAVVGVLIKEGTENSAFTTLFGDLPSVAGEETELTTSFNAENLLPKSRRVYRYSGSLTTPPCTESVSWSLFAEPIELSSEQIKQFVDVLNESCCTFNNRPVQPLHGRELDVDTGED